MKYNNLEGRPDLVKIQDEVLDFWAADKTFEKSLNKQSGKEVVFYDGPPFPTGTPHHGTVLVSFIKDMVARYWTMRGFKVDRVWGWDCHGLPTETQAEKVLGITDKRQIEAEYGIARFNEACFNVVSGNNEAWRRYIREMCRWVDYDNSYKTMDFKFMESVLWAFKECYNKGLIYRDFRVTPYCCRCETALSISDTRESDSTRPKQDTWCIARFKTQEELNGKSVYLLAWTTTPWTLPSNLALAVNKDLEYSYVEVEDAVYVAGASAVSRYPKVFGEKPAVVKSCSGSALIGAVYEPIFDYFADKNKEGAFRVIAAEFVSCSDGVGIVHIAPGFGEDDYWAGKASGLPFVCPVDEKGRFTAEVADFAGLGVVENSNQVLRHLKQNGKVIADGSLVHNYPHCWRCKSPLIYKAMNAWYFNIEKIKDKLMQENENIDWVPEAVKEGRFGSWVKNARDWNISRNRYWSTPIPVWKCDSCQSEKVLGSAAEIEEVSGVRLTDLHRQYVDEVTFKCKCGGTFRRTPEVLDCWFEAGSMPFAQKHYPFENKDWFDSHYPCDFIVEYPGQIKGWFYVLHVLAVALFGKPAFKNCLVHGTLLDKEGKKLSKSSKNYTDSMELMRKYGTDAYRLYLYQSNAMLLGDVVFEDSGIEDALQQVVLPFYNACSFFTSYANIDEFYGDDKHTPSSQNQLDRWILAKLYNAECSITKAMDNYQIDQYVKHLLPLIDGLTNWYIRRSRRRFWADGMGDDKRRAYETLYYVLVNICRLLAPVAPVISERLYQHLTGQESVHLADWPVIPQGFSDEKLLLEVEVVQNVIKLARALRNKNSVKNRQPLSKLQVVLTAQQNAEAIKKATAIIAEELNVKTVKILDDVNLIAEVKYVPNFTRLGPKLGSKLPAVANQIRGGQFKAVSDGYELDINGQAIALDSDDILVSYQAKEGLHVISEGGIVVSLDLTITPELKDEGIAREIVRNIQDARKSLNCQIMETIQIEIRGNYPKQWLEYICTETLSEVTKIDSPDTTCVIEDDAPITILIKRKNN
ncbi:MAG: isoleucine--tRNA ligase [Firmicutes bacterium]|nr:isoleucine--tRNA ligase [Bacillota bacterium]